MSANNRLHWVGLDELRAALLQLPEDLASDAESIVNDAAQAAFDEIYAAYPVRTGNLRNGLKVQTLSHAFDARVGSRALGAGAILYNNAPHAYMFEHGTEARHTDIGADRGRMPPGKVFIPRVMRHRRRMYEELVAMMESHGLLVTGSVYAAA